MGLPRRIISGALLPLFASIHTSCSTVSNTLNGVLNTPTRVLQGFNI
ncbi:MAG: hypothetical protein PUD60_07800 [Akkermansia muciniphila]|nr:hypothetical protein [Akkermansia muciniphila]